MTRTYDSDSDEYGTAIAVINKTCSRNCSATGRRLHYNDPIYVARDLLPIASGAGGRHRSSSTGAATQYHFVKVVVDGRSPERECSHGRRLERGRRWQSVQSDEDMSYSDCHRRTSKRKIQLSEDMILKLAKLKFLEKQEKEREHEKILKKELELEKARELYEKEEKAKKEKDLQKEYVEKWKREEAEKKEKVKREKEEEDKKFAERFKIQFMQAGYTEVQAEAILQKKKRENKKKHQNSMVISLSQPTWIKVKRKWLLPETLDHYFLPWEWDKDSEYLVIKQNVDQDLQDRLFEHTRMLKERKRIAGPVEMDTVTMLKVRDKSKDKTYLVRKKSKALRRGLHTSPL